MDKLTIDVTRVRVSTQSGTTTRQETLTCRNWAHAVTVLRAIGATEWSGDGFTFRTPDRRSVTAHVSGPGAYRAWAEMYYGTADANMHRRSPDPILGGAISDAWDGHDPWGSALAGGFAICYVMYAADIEIPDEWDFSPGMVTYSGVEELMESDDDFIIHEIATDYLAGRVTAEHLTKAGRILHRYLNLIPEDQRY